MTTGVAILLYGRAESSIAVIEALLRQGAPHAYVFMDGPRKPEIEAEQARMLQFLDTLPEGLVSLHRHRENLGLAAAMRFAVGHVLERHESVLVLEDDCVLRPGGLRYFTDGLAALHDNRRVRSLCGYLTPGCPFFYGYDDDAFLLQRFNTWGWATWRDRWADYQPDLRQVLARFEALRMRVEDVTGDLARLCQRDDYLRGHRNVWSIPWILEHFLTGTYAVFPTVSVIENIGFDGTGENCTTSDAFRLHESRPFGRVRSWKRLPYYLENEEAIFKFMNEHGLETYS